MDTKSTMIEYRLSNWVELVQDRECSGLSIKDYCVGIAEHIVLLPSEESPGGSVYRVGEIAEHIKRN